MDERSKKLLEAEVRFLENKYGVNLVVLPATKDKQEALSELRLGRESKAVLVHRPVNELPC